MAGVSSEDIRAETTAEIAGEKLSPRGMSFFAETFDSAYGIRLRYSRKTNRCCAVCDGWNGTLRFGGLDGGVKISAVEVTGHSMQDFGKASVKLGYGEASADLPAGNSADDHSVCRAVFDEPAGGGELIVNIGGGCVISEIVLIPAE